MKKILTIGGMSCTACAKSIERALSKTEGVLSASVNFATEELLVDFEETKCDIKRIILVIQKAGFKASEKLDEEKISSAEKSPIWFWVSVCLSIVLLYISMGHMMGLPIPQIISPSIHPLAFALTQAVLAIVVASIGNKFFRVGFSSLFRLQPNMDSLIAVSCLASFIYGAFAIFKISVGEVHYVHNLYFESVAVVITLVTLGKTLEAKAKKKTGEAVRKLTALQPQFACIEIDGEQKTIPISEVKVGNTLIVKAGEKFPVDGIITQGQTVCDESMLTGESMPVDKVEGSSVVAASLNVGSFVKVLAERVGDDTTLSQIVRFVKNAQGTKVPVAKLADKIAGVFVPVVMSLALLAAVSWLIAGRGFAFAFEVFVATLVIACPCSLGLATPTAITVAVGKGAELGILIKNGQALETACKIKTVAFDKTGTLTVGKPQVLGFKIYNEMNREKVLEQVASCENASEHPLAKAIVNYAKQNNVSPKEVKNVSTESGKGITCECDGVKIAVGSLRFLQENGMLETFEKQQSGKTVVYMSVNDKLACEFELFDMPKVDSKNAILALKRLNIKTTLISGDNVLTAQTVKDELAMDNAFGEILPEGKASLISKLKEKGEVVAMVGDGINDSPALSVADVGISVGNGSDIAVDSADIVLVGGDVINVATAIELSKKTMKNIKENLFWAFIYNVICIPIAMGVLAIFGGPLLNPMLGGLAMSFSSVCVVLYALRLKLFEPTWRKIKLGEK